MSNATETSSKVKSEKFLWIQGCLEITGVLDTTNCEVESYGMHKWMQ